MAPVSLKKLTMAAVMVPLVCVIVPEPSTVKVAVCSLPAFRAPLNVMLPLEPAAVDTVRPAVAVIAPVVILPVAVTVSEPAVALIVPVEEILAVWALPPVDVVTESDPSLESSPVLPINNALVEALV